MNRDNYREYSYSGPVEEFGKCISNKWTATTFAPSERKARCNLAYRFKQEYGKTPTAQINLPGKIVMLG